MYLLNHKVSELHSFDTHESYKVAGMGLNEEGR
jgi:hypothetical protein